MSFFRFIRKIRIFFHSYARETYKKSIYFILRTFILPLYCMMDTNLTAFSRIQPINEELKLFFIITYIPDICLFCV